MRIVFVAADSSGTPRIYLRERDALVARAIPGTGDATLPFWAPDSGRLGFFAHGQLKTIPIAGGTPRVLAAAPVPRGGTWSRDEVILFVGVPNRPPYLVSAFGGESTQVAGDGSRRWFPSFLPDGRHYLYLGVEGTSLGYSIRGASLDSTDTVELVRSQSPGVYVAPGYLLFLRDGVLVAQPFDAATLRLSGRAVTIVEDVGYNAITYRALFSASQTGALV